VSPNFSEYSPLAQLFFSERGYFIHSDDCSLSSLDLFRRSQRLSMELAPLIEPGARLNLWGENSFSTLVALGACLLARGNPVLLSNEGGSSAQIGLPRREKICVNEEGEYEFVTRAEPILWPLSILKQPIHAPAMGFLTSGTSGEPKLLFHNFTSIDYLCRSVVTQLFMGPESKCAAILPIQHVSGGLLSLLPALSCGAQVTLHSPLAVGIRFKQLLDSAPTHLTLTPYLLKILNREREIGGLDPLHSMQHLIVSGDHCDASHFEAARACFPEARLYRSYGLTEAPRCTLITESEPPFHRFSCGRPSPEVEIKILRTDQSEALPGEVGQVHVRGPNVAQELTDDAHFLATGDWGHLDGDGYLYIDKRGTDGTKTHDRQPKLRLAERLANSIDASVSSIGLFIDSNSQPYPVLFFEGPSVAPEAMAKFVCERLPRGATPKAVVRIKCLPFSHSQKIDSERLKQLFREKQSMGPLVLVAGIRVYDW
jgi:acyl-CoA synthetase (AMP-forming)/AMP-acid ligase II